jgi:hypothetical protein
MCALARPQSYFERQREVWRQQVAKYAGRRLPDAIQDPAMRHVVDAFVASSDELAKTMHATIDTLAEDGTFSKMKATERDKRVAELERDIASRELALRRREVQVQADAEADRLRELDEHAAKVLT